MQRMIGYFIRIGNFYHLAQIHDRDLFRNMTHDQKIMGAVTKEGTPMIERRQGLLDRSKTIWAMVFPNDYEQVAQ